MAEFYCKNCGYKASSVSSLTSHSSFIVKTSYQIATKAIAISSPFLSKVEALL